MKTLVAIIMGSDSDWNIMSQAASALDEFDIPYKVEVISAHRTPERMKKFCLECEKTGVKVIIAGAGGAAHLPGMIASLTTLPVVGVPVKLKNLNGLDSLLSIVQMPKGVPVATMAIDNAYNAGLFSARIIATESKKTRNLLQKYQRSMKVKVARMNRNLKKALTDS